MPTPKPAQTIRPVNPASDSDHQELGIKGPYLNPTGASSEPTIGPWDSASQRDVPYVSTALPPGATVSAQGGIADYGGADGSGQMRTKSSTMMGQGLGDIDEERWGARPLSYGDGPGPLMVDNGQQGSENMAYIDRREPSYTPYDKDDPYASNPYGAYPNPYHPTASDPRGLSNPASETHELRSLVPGAAPIAGYYQDSYRRESKYGRNDSLDDSSPYAWPDLDNVNANHPDSYLRKESALMSLLLFPTGLDRLMGLFGMNKGKFPVAQQIERKRHGVPGQRFSVMTWILTAGMCIRASLLDKPLSRDTLLIPFGQLSDVQR